LGSAAWTASADGSLKFANLADGEYTLEAAYTGEGQPDVLRWTFRVGNPGLNLLMRLVGLGLATVIGLAAWVRREWLQYWLAKPFFLARTRLRQNEGGPVAWSNHAGRTFVKRFEIREPLSRGGFSVTYRARDLAEGKDVAVKVLHRAPGQESFVRHRFAHEVAALHTLHHPGVVRLIDSWISPEGEPCLAMEFLDGPTLRELGSPLPHARVAHLVEQIGSALAAIHQRGIVHRDLKPENIMVLGAGTLTERVVIIDFGTSAARGPEEDLESTTTLTGSLHYLAPERLTRQYSTASDVYSLGAIVLEMLTGKRPAEFEVAVMDPSFVRLAGVVMGEPAAARLAEALDHQPSKRPADIVTWTHELAILLLERS
jgi:serine/threonine protein kinase